MTDDLMALAFQNINELGCAVFALTAFVLLLILEADKTERRLLALEKRQAEKAEG